MAGVERAVVNVHHFADQIEAHLKTRKEPAITISDERGAILETGGGVLKALPVLGPGPFIAHNSRLSLDRRRALQSPAVDGCLGATADGWASVAGPPRLQALDMRAGATTTWMRPATCGGRLRSEETPYVFAGVSILKPRAFRWSDGTGVFAGQDLRPGGGAECASWRACSKEPGCTWARRKSLIEAESHLNEGQRRRA